MDANEFWDRLSDMVRDLTSLNKIEVVDGEGNPITEMSLNIKERKIILKSNKS